MFWEYFLSWCRLSFHCVGCLLHVEIPLLLCMCVFMCMHMYIHTYMHVCEYMHVPVHVGRGQRKISRVQPYHPLPQCLETGSVFKLGFRLALASPRDLVSSPNAALGYNLEHGQAQLLTWVLGSHLWAANILPTQPAPQLLEGTL